MRKQNDLAARKFQRVVMGMRIARTDLTESSQFAGAGLSPE